MSVTNCINDGKIDINFKKIKKEDWLFPMNCVFSTLPCFSSLQTNGVEVFVSMVLQKEVQSEPLRCKSTLLFKI